MKMKQVVLAMVFAAGAMFVSGRDLCYSGNGSTGWDTDNTRRCWTDQALGSRTFYVEGDNLLVDDTLMINGVRVMQNTSAWLAATIVPGNLEFNIADTFTVTSSGYNFFGAQSIVKNGAGTLTWDFSGSNNGYTTPVIISNGVLVCSKSNGYAGYVPVQNNALREYIINNGAELRVTARNCFGKCDLYTIAGAGGGCVRVKKGGKFSLYVPDKSAHCGSSVWDLYLEGGDVDFQAVGVSGNELGLLLINHKLSVLGDTACAISNTPGYACQYLAINKFTPTTFDIADVTGDDNPDLKLDIPLTQASGGTPQFVKQGAGTLLMLTRTNLFKSDMVIKEGTVKLDYHPGQTSEFGSCGTTVLGDLTVAGRTITVCDSGKLELMQRNMFVAYSGGVNGGNTIASELVITNGGTVLAHGGLNLGPVTVADGKIEFFNVDYGWGALSVRGTMKVRGTTPFTLKFRGTQCRQILYREYATVFDVADVTGDAEADFITGLPFVMPNYADYYTDSTTGEIYPYGFVKTGAGTMVTTGDSYSGAIAMNGEVRVTEGTLQVDGNIGKSSAVVVSAGAYLAGVGTVNNVQIAAGGGFRKTANQTEPLKLRGNLTIGANPVIRIDNLDGGPSNKIRATLFTVTGTVTGAENLGNATVYLDNAVWGRGRYIIEYSASTRTCSIKGVNGTRLMIR